MENKTNQNAERFESAISKIFTSLNHRTTLDPITMLPIAQVRLMRALSEGPRTPSDLAEAMSITASAVTQLTNRLVKAGMVVRAEDEKDRRVRRLKLSSLGIQLFQERQAKRVDNARRVLESFTCEEQELVFKGLSLIVAASQSMRSRGEPDCYSLSAELRQDPLRVRDSK